MGRIRKYFTPEELREAHRIDAKRWRDKQKKKKRDERGVGRPRLYEPGTEKEMQLKKQRERIQANRVFVSNYKRQLGCETCGEKDPIVLDLDHIEPHTKEKNVSSLLSRRFEILWKEIEKCRVLCANCHRRVTYKQTHS